MRKICSTIAQTTLILPHYCDFIFTITSYVKYFRSVVHFIRQPIQKIQTTVPATAQFSEWLYHGPVGLTCYSNSAFYCAVKRTLRYAISIARHQIGGGLRPHLIHCRELQLLSRLFVHHHRFELSRPSIYRIQPTVCSRMIYRCRVQFKGDKQPYST